MCHAAGAHFLNPHICSIIDIGGQDSKAILLDDKGKVKNFVMNDKCAAGTGRFLEVMARAMEVNLDEFGAMSIKSKQPSKISSLCTVFAESEVISLIAKGEQRQDIIAGIHESIAARVSSMVGRVGIKEPVMITGGVARNIGVVHALEKKLEIAHNNVSAQQGNLKIAEAKFRGGSSSQRDVEQARTVLGGTQASIPSLESQLQQTKNALCLLLGLSPRKLDKPLGAGARDALIPSPPVDVAVGIPADLLRRRPDIRKAEMAAAAQSARIGVAKANLYPAFSLSGSFGFVSSNATGNSLSDIFQWSSHFYRFGPAVQWNIFNYGQISNQVRTQDALLQETLTDYQNTVLTAQREVEDGLIAFLKNQDAADYLAQSTAAAQRSLNLATIQYREGIADFTTVLTAEQSLLSQQDSFATTLGDIASSLVNVYRALGGGWQIREGQDFVPAPIKEAMARRTHWGDLLEPMPVPAERATNLIRAPEW
jgi:hypothetical protein